MDTIKGQKAIFLTSRNFSFTTKLLSSQIKIGAVAQRTPTCKVLAILLLLKGSANALALKNLIVLDILVWQYFGFIQVSYWGF